MSSTAIPEETIQAYQETAYRVESESQFTLLVDMQSPALLALYKRTGGDCCAFITACNPLGAMYSDQQNADLQGAFEVELKRRSLSYLNGIGQHPANEWPGEPSFLVLGLSLEAARTLGTQLKQNAIVWCGPDAIPKLILLR